MNHNYEYKAAWNKDVKQDHTLKIDLDLTLSDLLAGRDLAIELVTHETEIRRQIFEMVIHELLPQIIDESGINGRLPEGKVRTTSHIKTHSDWKVTESQEPRSSVSIRSKMQMLLEIKGDRSMNAMQALHMSNSNLAHAITEDIMSALKHKYLGKTKHETTSENSISNGKLVDYQTKTKPDFQGQN